MKQNKENIENNDILYTSRLHLLERLANDRSVNAIYVLNILDMIEPNAIYYRRSLIDFTIEYVKNTQKIDEEEIIE